MSIIEKSATSKIKNIVPLKKFEYSYNINEYIKNRFIITSLPINFPHKLIGRKNEIQDILKNVQNDKMIIIVNGMGGIGKTSLCKYIFDKESNELKKIYSHIAWVNYKNNIANSFVNAFESLDIPFKENSTLDDKFQKIISELSKLGDKLLIFIDNIDKTSKTDKNLRKLLVLQSHIIITSRIHIYNDNYIYNLKFLDLERCIEIFLENYRYSYENIENEINSCLPTIIKLCGNHTLTIELLSKSATVNEIKLSNLLHLLEIKKFDLSIFKNLTYTNWDDQLYKRTLSNHITKVFSISKISKRQKEMLFRISFLSTSPIIITDLKKILSIDEKTLRNLINMGWINCNNNYVQIHSCIKYALTSQNRNKLKNYTFILDEISHFLDWREIYTEATPYISHAEEICYRFGKSKTIKLYENYRKLARYYKYQGNMKSCINYIKKQISISRKQNAKNEAECYKTIGTIYAEIGCFSTATEYIIKSLHKRKYLYNYYSFERSECYAHLGYIFQEQGHYRKALTNYYKSLEIRNKLTEDKALYLGYSYNNLATLLSLMYDYNNANNYADKALEIRKNLIDTDENNQNIRLLDLAQTQCIKGYILSMKKEYEQAIIILTQSLEERKLRLGKYHLATATTFERLAYAQCLYGKIDEASKNIKFTLDIYEHNAYVSPIDLAVTYNTLAIIKRFENNCEEAMKYHKLSISSLRKKLGDNHPRLIKLYKDYGDTLSTRNEDLANIMYNKSIQIYEKYFGRQ